MKNKYDFGQKYQAGGIGKRLIDNFYQQLFDLIKELKLSNVFEVGAGEGYSSQKILDFLPNNVKFEASEFNSELIDKIKEKVGKNKVSSEDIYLLSRLEGEFDMVFCLEVLEHLTNPKDAIKELHRITNKYAVVSVPNEPLWRTLNMARGKYWRDWGNTPGHIQHWNLMTIKKELEPYFSVIKVAQPTPWNILLLKRKNEPKHRNIFK